MTVILQVSECRHAGQHRSSISMHVALCFRPYGASACRLPSVTALHVETEEPECTFASGLCPVHGHSRPQLQTAFSDPSVEFQQQFDTYQGTVMAQLAQALPNVAQLHCQECYPSILQAVCSLSPRHVDIAFRGEHAVRAARGTIPDSTQELVMCTSLQESLPMYNFAHLNNLRIARIEDIEHVNLLPSKILIQHMDHCAYTPTKVEQVQEIQRLFEQPSFCYYEVHTFSFIPLPS